MVPLPPPLLGVAALRAQGQPARSGAYPAQTGERVAGGRWLLRGGDPAGHRGHGLRARGIADRAPLVRIRLRRPDGDGAMVARIVARRDDHPRYSARPTEGLDLRPGWP